jgi:hypothetical protein
VQSDWYKTKKAGTYLVVAAGADLWTLALPDNVRTLLDLRTPFPFAENVDSHARALTFNLLGIDDCLNYSGFCVIRN